MPESHPGIQFTRKKIRKPSNYRPSPESGTAGKTGSQRRQTSPARYRQIQRSKPQERRYQIKAGQHGDKFVGPRFKGERGGQVVDQRGTGKAERRLAGYHLRSLLANYLSQTSVGRGLEAGHAALIYEKLKPLFGPGAKMPDYRIGGTEKARTMGGGKVGGFASGHEIHLSEDEARDLLPLIAPFGGALGTQLVAHETAHTQQSKRTPSVLKEGGADAFAEAASAILGKPKVRMSGEYGKYDRAFNKATGKYKLYAALQAQFPKARKAYGK